MKNPGWKQISGLWRLLVWLGFLLPGAGLAETVNFQQNISFISTSDPSQSNHYALFIPAGLQSGTNYPLVVFLHGSGNRGTDTTAASLREGAQIWARATNQLAHPLFVLAPVVPTNQLWADNTTNGLENFANSPYPMKANPTPNLRMMVELVHSLEQTKPIDPKRIYLVGESMGGYGAWEAAVRYPTLWAAVIPLMGGTDPSKAAIIKNLPIWTFHAANDPTVPVTGTRKMVSALQGGGGHPLYVEFATGGHGISAEAVNYPAQSGNPSLLDWTYQQAKMPSPTNAVGNGAATSAVTSLTVLTNAIANPTRFQMASPDGSLLLTFALSNFDGSASCPVYNLSRNGQTLIGTSKLGLTFGTAGLMQNYLTLVSETNSSNDSVWQPVYAEKSQIRDNYNQLVVRLRELIPPYRLLQLVFRVYNEGAAFFYTIPSQAGLAGATNLTEQSEFRFAADYPAWATYTAQGVYTRTTISGIASGCERPLTARLATNLYVALGEAGLVDHSRMKFAPLFGKRYSLISLLDGPVTNPLPLTTPWRFIMVGDTPGQLLENNFFVLNLNAPCALTNTSWIKPGKVIRETTLKTVSGKACVDFAAKHGIQYIEFDAGWYGRENATLTATNAVSPLDLPGVINYAALNNVGVILYVNWLAMTNELSLLPPLYHDWGVKGIKYGFVSVGPQRYTEIVNDAARICASNQMMLEVHDEFRPSGYTRTYPNFMTVEGVSGDETTPTATQDTTLLFSRMLVGGADHTVCYFDPRVTNKWNNAYQLAKAVCFYSPWQYLYWYDRPTNSYGYVSGGKDMITEVPEMEFYDYMPTVWDETRVLQGSIGQYAIIARRTGTQWFIGAMNAGSTRTFKVSLDFLKPGRRYIGNVYSQDPSVLTRTHVRIDRLAVDSTATLTMTLDASSGEAVRLLPSDPLAIQSLSRIPGDGLGLTITGKVSRPFSLWSSPDLALPGSNWTLLDSGLITNNSFLAQDLFTSPQGFYRCSTR